MPSNIPQAVRAVQPPDVSIRRTDLCAFERGVLIPPFMVSLNVSIRRTDLCAFEQAANAVLMTVPNCFNPSNGFVCLRTFSVTIQGLSGLQFQSVERICVPSNYADAALLSQALTFQSVERICVPSNSGRSFRLARMSHCFNPSNGFVCLRTPPSWPRRSPTASVSIRRTDLCAFEPLPGVGASIRSVFQSVERICVPSNSPGRGRGREIS